MKQKSDLPRNIIPLSFIQSFGIASSFPEQRKRGVSFNNSAEILVTLERKLSEFRKFE